MEERHCLDCGEIIRGRLDKKFCSDQCRNNYNNRLHRDEYAVVRKVNAVLRNNYKILCALNQSGKTILHRDKMLEAGYNFKYLTSILKTRSNTIYYFCYDQGYMEIENNLLTLVKKEKGKKF